MSSETDKRTERRAKSTVILSDSHSYKDKRKSRFLQFYSKKKDEEASSKESTCPSSPHANKKPLLPKSDGRYRNMMSRQYDPEELELKEKKEVVLESMEQGTVQNLTFGQEIQDLQLRSLTFNNVPTIVMLCYKFLINTIDKDSFVDVTMESKEKVKQFFMEKGFDKYEAIIDQIINSDKPLKTLKCDDLIQFGMKKDTATQFYTLVKNEREKGNLFRLFL